MLSEDIKAELAAAQIDLKNAIAADAGATVDQREAARRCNFDVVRACHDKAQAAKAAAADARVRIADAEGRLAIAQAAEAAANG